MESGNFFVILLIMLLIATSTGCITNIDFENTHNDNAQYEYVPLGSNISIACWNLQIFGPSKASNETLIEYYIEKLRDYDIFIVQEIRDASGTAIETLAMGFPDHQYILSDRAGQSSSKEQYAVFYNNQATMIGSYDYQAEYQQEMQRPPLKCTFASNNWTFTIYTVHTQPDYVFGELSVIETIIGNPVGDTIIMGDLNADGSYYDEDNIKHFTDWNWVITNDVDTTVAASDNTYDRIIINDATMNNFLSFGVMDDVDNDKSDHYMIYGYFNNEKE
jgi:deoxyribonuclease-1-like protein